jgi:hypothetical protein
MRRLVFILMSFLLDPLALLVIGFVVSKVNYLTVIFQNRFFTRGASKRYVIIFGILVTALFWAYSSLLYLNVIYFPWPLPRWFGGPDWMLNSGFPFGLSRSSNTDIAAVVIFATYPAWFFLGAELGLAGTKLTNKRRLEERDLIIKELVRAAFPVGGAIPAGADQVDSAGTVKELLTKIPRDLSSALTMLLFVFDSRFLVFALTGKWKRFVKLDELPGRTLEKRRYFEAWETNPYLVTVVQILKVVTSFGYFTKPAAYKSIGYSGPLIPNDPPWYNPGPSTQTMSQAGGTKS